VLHELLAGQRPFQATRFTALVTQILEEAPAPVPLDVELPAGVADVLRRCLEKDPAKRFATTAELALALLPYARPRAHSAVARAVAQVRTAGLDPHLEMPSSMPPRPSDATEVPPISALRPPRVPTFDDLALESAAPVAAAAASPARPRWIAAVLLVGFALMAFAGVMLMRMAEQPEGRPSSPAATPSPAAAVSIANGDGVANAASAVAESPAVSTPARREASPPPVRTGAPVALPRPAAAPARPSASSAPSDFDIRPTR
jgi:serine/threonine-protein kinase